MKFNTKLLVLIFFFFTTYSTIILQPKSTGMFRFVETGIDTVFSDPELSLYVISNLDHGDPGLQGVYVKNTMQLSVVDQPADMPGFVSSSPDVVTDFAQARLYGSIGLLAHNNLAGEVFNELDEGEEIVLVYGNGKVEKYVVSEIREFQATEPLSPYSSFINLTDPNAILTNEELFFDTYGVAGRLILQTCISKSNDDSWGRLFIIADELISN